jgi:hypothetical protein
MKNIIILFSIIILVGCNLQQYNVDPNRLTSERIGLANRLPTIEYDLANILAGNIVKRISNTVNQTYYRQGPTGLNNYVYTPGDASNINLWADLYTKPMNGASQIIELATQENSSVYRGIAKIVMAIGLANLTTIWGDVPFSQSFNVNEFPYPKFDSQQSIYIEIQKLLDDAIVDLNNASGKLKPTSDDLIFGGNTSKWIKTANALKARYYLHLVKVDADAYTKAESALNLALGSNEDNCVFTYSNGNPGQQSPIYLERVTTRDVEVDPTFAKRIQSLGDPREKFYAVIKSSLLSGTRAQFGPLYAMPDSYFPIMTYEECLFMKTEIAMKTNGKAAAEPLLESAVNASLIRVCKKQIGSNDSTNNNLVLPIADTILAQYAKKVSKIGSLTTSDNVAWQTIFEQKSIALFLQAEVWNDYRRTEKYVEGIAGLPLLLPRTGNSIPRRYQYSSNEINANKNAPPQQEINNRIWWDAQ